MISIITPSFNRGYIIEETAESIFAQTCEDWEWIIVDDGSTDDSWDKLETFREADERVRIFRRNREPKGACTCRNIGAEMAKGTHIMFLDTDDLISPNCIKKRIDWIATSSAPNLITFSQSVVFESSPYQGFLWDDPENPVSWLSGLFTSSPPCQGTAPLWPKDKFIDIGGWREDLRVWQDIELHIRAFAKGWCFQPSEDLEPDIFLRLSPDSISHVGFHSKEKLFSRWEVVKSVMQWYQCPDFDEQELAAFQRMVLSVFQNALNHRDWVFSNEVINHTLNGGFISSQQANWMSSYSRIYLWTLYRLPFTMKFVENRNCRLFPVPFSRTLGKIVWNKI